eukprot:g2164.t1
MNRSATSPGKRVGRAKGRRPPSAKWLATKQVLDVRIRADLQARQEKTGGILKALRTNDPFVRKVELPRAKLIFDDVKEMRRDRRDRKHAVTSGGECQQILKTIDVSYNNLTQLVGGTFLDLPALESAYFRDSQIKTLDVGVFQRCAKLKTIDFSNHKLEQLVGGTFVDLPALESADFRNNQIKTLAAGVFQRCAKLKTIDFSGSNKLEQLVGGTFVDLPALESAYFRDSQIKTLAVGVFQRCAKLKFIDFSNHKLEQLVGGTFVDLPALESADFRFNQIKTLAAGVFQRCAKLKTIDFSNNNLTQLVGGTFVDLPALLSVDLSHNPLRIIASGAFSILKRLNIVDLRGTPIEEIQPEAFEGTYTIQEVHMGGPGSSSTFACPGSMGINLVLQTAQATAECARSYNNPTLRHRYGGYSFYACGEESSFSILKRLKKIASPFVYYQSRGRCQSCDYGSNGLLSILLIAISLVLAASMTLTAVGYKLATLAYDSVKFIMIAAVCTILVHAVQILSMIAGLVVWPPPVLNKLFLLFEYAVLNINVPGSECMAGASPDLANPNYLQAAMLYGVPTILFLLHAFLFFTVTAFHFFWPPPYTMASGRLFGMAVGGTSVLMAPGLLLGIILGGTVVPKVVLMAFATMAICFVLSHKLRRLPQIARMTGEMTECLAAWGINHDDVANSFAAVANDLLYSAPVAVLLCLALLLCIAAINGVCDRCFGLRKYIYVKAFVATVVAVLACSAVVSALAQSYFVSVLWMVGGLFGGFWLAMFAGCSIGRYFGSALPKLARQLDEQGMLRLVKQSAMGFLCSIYCIWYTGKLRNSCETWYKTGEASDGAWVFALAIGAPALFVYQVLFISFIWWRIRSNVQRCIFLTAQYKHGWKVRWPLIDMLLKSMLVITNAFLANRNGWR